MYLSEFRNMCANEKVCIYGEDDKFIDDDESVSDYLIKHYGDCEVLDVSIAQDDDNNPFLIICIDDSELKDDDDNDDNRKPSYNDLSLDDSDYQADYDRMQWGAHAY